LRWSSKKVPLCFCCSVGLGCSVAPSSVDRVADGTTIRGRYISHASYAAYASGAQLEALGEFARAEQSYRRALEYDPDSPEIWTRLGAVRCMLKRPDTDAAFAKARALAPTQATLWLAEARCELRRGHPDKALRAGRRSLKLDPNHLETSLVISQALNELGRQEEAHDWLRALRARHPGSAAAEIWLGQLAGHEAQPQGEAALDRVDQALVAGSVDLATQLGLDAGLAPSELAAREQALGRTEQALDRVARVLAADPSDGTAWAVRLDATDLLRREQDYETGLRKVTSDSEPPDALSWLLLADLIQRRVNREAARAWFERAPQPSRPDPLVDDLRNRLRRELK
jgi:Tfp pilus assembly protein PilF